MMGATESITSQTAKTAEITYLDGNKEHII